MGLNQERKIYEKHIIHQVVEEIITKEQEAEINESRKKHIHLLVFLSCQEADDEILSMIILYYP